MYAREHIILQCKDCNFNYKISYDNLFRLKSKIIKCMSCLINVIENKCKDLGYKMIKYKSEEFLEIECFICNNKKIYKGLQNLTTFYKLKNDGTIDKLCKYKYKFNCMIELSNYNVYTN
jgi:GTP-sensing pleiotropic transcriptional regulator CodY